MTNNHSSYLLTIYKFQDESTIRSSNYLQNWNRIFNIRFALKNDFSTSTRTDSSKVVRRKAKRQTFPRLFARWWGANVLLPLSIFLFLSTYKQLTKRKVIDDRTFWVVSGKFHEKSNICMTKKEENYEEARKNIVKKKIVREEYFMNYG